jgi:hypothetical protein
MFCHVCHLNNTILEPCRPFKRMWLVLFSRLNPSEYMLQSVRPCITFIQHSFTACILNLTLALWGSQWNCQQSFHLSPLTTIRKMELPVSAMGLSAHLMKHRIWKRLRFTRLHWLEPWITSFQQCVITAWMHSAWWNDLSLTLATSCPHGEVIKTN